MYPLVIIIIWPVITLPFLECLQLVHKVSRLSQGRAGGIWPGHGTVCQASWARHLRHSRGSRRQHVLHHHCYWLLYLLLWCWLVSFVFLWFVIPLKTFEIAFFYFLFFWWWPMAAYFGLISASVWPLRPHVLLRPYCWRPCRCDLHHF